MNTNVVTKDTGEIRIHLKLNHIKLQMEHQTVPNILNSYKYQTNSLMMDVLSSNWQNNNILNCR